MTDQERPSIVAPREYPQMAPPDPESRFGDRTDREVPYVGGLLNPRNAGLYGAEYTPTQRYTGYVMAYLMFAEAVASGTIDQLSDEMILMLAWAPEDVDAIEAGRELAFGSSGYMDEEGNFTGVEAEQPEMQGIHNSLFGEGFFDFPGYEELYLPKIGNDESGPQNDQTERYQYRMMMALAGEVRADLDKPGKPDLAALRQSTYRGPGLEPQPFPFGFIENKLGQGREALTGEVFQSTPEQLFITANQRAHEEGSVKASATSYAANTAGLTVNLIGINKGLKLGFGAIGLVGGAMKMVKGGIPIAQVIANGLDSFRKGTQFYSRIRFPLQAATAATAVATLSTGVIMDFMGSPTQQWQDFTSDYQVRKLEAQRTGDTTWVDDPNMEMFVQLQSQYETEERQNQLFEQKRNKEIERRGRRGVKANTPWWEKVESPYSLHSTDYSPTSIPDRSETPGAPYRNDQRNGKPKWQQPDDSSTIESQGQPSLTRNRIM